jgi:hypothetical protein
MIANVPPVGIFSRVLMFLLESAVIDDKGMIWCSAPYMETVHIKAFGYRIKNISVIFSFGDYWQSGQGIFFSPPQRGHTLSP